METTTRELYSNGFFFQYGRSLLIQDNISKAFYLDWKIAHEENRFAASTNDWFISTKFCISTYSNIHTHHTSKYVVIRLQKKNCGLPYSGDLYKECVAKLAIY